MTIVLLAELVSTSVRLALSLKVISIISTLRLAQSVVLVQMFVLLKQFIRENNTILRKRKKKVCQNAHLHYFTYKAPTFTSWGFVIT